MGKFKVGDRVKRIVASDWPLEFGELGKEYTVLAVNNAGNISVVEGVNGATYGSFELVEQTAAWQPKVGDRVTTNDSTKVDIEKHWNDHFSHSAGGIVDGALVVTSVADRGGSNVGLSNKPGRSYFFMPAGALRTADLAAAPAAITIEAGKFYKTRDGRKVGPMIYRGGYWSAGGGCNGTPGHFSATGLSAYRGVIPRDEARAEHDLIAEWVDEPVKASNDNGATLGDILHAAIGQTVTVQVKRQTQAIVALIENGQPKPSERPHVHASEYAATKEAQRLASLYRGKQFGVYVLTATRQEAAPVYLHEWQRLAANGEKIPAIKALRDHASLDLRSAKIAVEAFAEKIAA